MTTTDGKAKKADGKARGERIDPVKFRMGLAGVMRWSDRFTQKVVGAYDQVFNIDDEDVADIYTDVGVDYATEGKADTAAEALEKALKLQPDNQKAWFHLGKVRLLQGRPADAGKAFERSRALGDDTFELHYLWATAHGDQQNLAGEVSELRAAVALKADAGEAYYRLGVALDKLKKYEESVVAFEKAIEIAPREVNYYQSLGFTFDTMGQHEKAIGCFKRAVELERRK